ncbi:ATP-binding protein [Vreelandella rituensis]|nr:ATP-binding protein [Halomonas rituensis]
MSAPQVLRYPRRLKGVAIIAVMLFAAALVVASLVAWRQDGLTRSLREDTAWVAYKLDRDTVQLLNHLLGTLPAPIEESQRQELSLRFELLYSRINLLTGGEISELLQSIPAGQQLIPQIQQALDALDPLIVPAASFETPHLRELEARIKALAQLTERFVIAINGHLAKAATQARNQLNVLYSLLLSLIMAMSLAALLVVIFLVREMRESTAARREQELLSHQLKVTAHQAQAASRAKSDFLAIVSHEVRTPLNGVIGMSELLLAPVKSENVRDYAYTIHESANQLLELINEILDFSKIEAGHLTLEAVPTQIKPLVESVAALFKPKAQAKGVALKVTFDTELPEWILMDAGRLRQILLNLIANAIKFTKHGSIQVSVFARAGDLYLSVSDTGCGLTSLQQARLFEPFQQADNSVTRRYGGTGLGLAICKRLVVAMQGQIDVESTPGQGSEFWLKLPLVKAEPQRLPDALIPAQQHFNGVTLLLVEDNPVNQKVAVGMLEHLGCKVICAGTGGEALSCVKNQQVALIFMDIQLPDMDGLEITRQLREQTGWLKEVPIVAMTAGGYDDDRARCLAAGMSGYITKPLSLTVLDELLSRQLEPPLSPTQRLCWHDPANLAPLLDTAILENLSAMLGVGGVVQLVELHHQHINYYLADLMALSETEITAGNHAAEAPSNRVSPLREIGRLAHQLRGESASLGGARLARQAKDVELLAQEENQFQIDAALQQLFETAERTLAAMEAWRNVQVSG